MLQQPDNHFQDIIKIKTYSMHMYINLLGPRLYYCVHCIWSFGKTFFFYKNKNFFSHTRIVQGKALLFGLIGGSFINSINTKELLTKG